MEDIRNFYYGNAKTDEERALQYVQMKTDFTQLYNIERMMRTHAQKSNKPTYYLR